MHPADFIRLSQQAEAGQGITAREASFAKQWVLFRMVR